MAGNALRSPNPNLNMAINHPLAVVIPINFFVVVYPALVLRLAPVIQVLRGRGAPETYLQISGGSFFLLFLLAWY